MCVSGSSSSIVAARAVVVPRACRLGSTARLPLEQLVLPYVRQSEKGAIFLFGEPGSGKTTALRHLRAALPSDARIAYFDNPNSDHWQHLTHEMLVIVAMCTPTWFEYLATFTLATWTEDDCLEYLAHTHRE